MTTFDWAVTFMVGSLMCWLAAAISHPSNAEEWSILILAALVICGFGYVFFTHWDEYSKREPEDGDSEW